MNLDGAKNGKKKSSQPEKTETGDKDSGPEVDMKTVYWNLVYNKLKWSRQEGQNVLQSCGGDFTLALVKIKQQMPG